MATSFIPSLFHPRAEGVGKVLGELEAKIMHAIWENKEGLGVQGVRTILHHAYKPLSTNATMTVMNRLVEKKLLAKEKKEGVFLYHATISYKDFTKMIAHHFLRALIHDPSLFSVAHFADMKNELDEETVKKLKQFVDTLDPH